MNEIGISSEQSLRGAYQKIIGKKIVQKIVASSYKQILTHTHTDNIICDICIYSRPCVPNRCNE